MGGSSSTPFDYNAQLMNDTVLQANQIDGKRPDGSSKIYRDVKVPIDGGFLSVPPTDAKVTTCWRNFVHGVEAYPSNKMLGTRAYSPFLGGDSKVYAERGDYVWETYQEVHDDAVNVGRALIGLGLGKDANVGILAVNRSEWVKVQLGIWSQAMRVVSLYATLGNDAVEYITNHAELEVAFVAPENLRVMKNVLHKVSAKSGEGKLKTVVVFDASDKYGNFDDTVKDEDVKACAEQGVDLIGFSAFMAAGAEKTDVQINEPEADDLSFIMYTSGTTGKPKGAMLSHGNVVAAVSTTDLRFALAQNDRHLSYLPLAHIFETAVQAGMIFAGGAIGFFQGNVKLLTADIAALKPTILAGVPRVFSRIYQKFWTNVGGANCIKRYVVNKAYHAQAALLRAGKPRSAAHDAKVFDKVKKGLGFDECRLMITGAAPCAPYLMEFCKIVLCDSILQGYGMTETSAIISVQNPGDPNMGNVGAPMPCCDVILKDVPEMEYLSTDKPCARGEVWVRGPNVFKGYFKNPEATASDLDQDGWLHTGDVGRWNPNGTLSIIDRKKNIFKLAQGEYIAAEKIENIYAKAGTVGQVWIYGNSFKSFVLAVVVPNAEYVHKYAASKGWWPSDPEANVVASDAFGAAFLKVCTDHEAAIKDEVYAGMKTMHNQLKGFEKARDIVLELKIDDKLQGFTEENDCLTPTFKLRRPFLLKRYVNVLMAAYAANGEANSADETWPGTK